MTSRFLSLRARLAALLVPLASALPLQAQAPAYPPLLEADPVASLSRYLRMLAANPRDLASLTGAGRAALAVGDANAALGFYARAEEIAPRNGRIKAGLAAALVQMEQPRAALKLFDEAVALGVPVSEIASDRGLASDLSGDGRRAQADYTLALRARDDDETLRRLALSMAISGDRAGALTMLEPLLRRRDGGAIRARAFVLALTGDQAGAANAVRAAMPGPQATVMANFLARLGKLNPAQKALAVNFGYFPSDGRSYSAAELFADARAAPLPGLVGGAPIGARGDAPLIPAGEALGPRYVTAATDADARSPRRRPGQAETIVEVAPPAHVLRAPTPGIVAVPVVRSGKVVAAPVALAAAVEGRPAGGVGAPAAIGTPTPIPPAAAMTAPPALAASTGSAAAVISSAAQSVTTVATAATASASPPAVTIPPASGASAGSTVLAQASPAATGGVGTDGAAAAQVAGALTEPPTAAPSLAAPAAAPVPSPIVTATGEPSLATPTAGGETVAPASIGIAAPGRPGGAAVIVSAVGPALATADSAPPAAISPASAPDVSRLAPIATDTLPPSAPAAMVADAPPTAPADTTRVAMLDATPRRGERGGNAVPDDAKRGAALADPATTKTGAAETAAPVATERGRRGAKDAGRNDVAGTDKAEKRPAGRGATGRGRAGAAASKASGAADAEAAESKSKDARAKNAKGTTETRLASAEKPGAGKRGEKTADKVADKSADKAKTAGRAKEPAKEKEPPKEKVAAKEKLPERYWVQVASGANKANLDKAWTNVKGKAPKLLQGQTTYTAPWRASNRLLIGPYKSEEEAQAQVNKLAKAGVSGIQFTTRAGADVEKVAAK